MLFLQVFIYSHVSHALCTFYARFENADKPLPLLVLHASHAYFLYLIYIDTPHKDIRGYRGIYIKGIGHFFTCKRATLCISGFIKNYKRAAACYVGVL